MIASQRAARGFTMIEIAIALAVLGILLAYTAAFLSTVQAGKNLAGTRTKLAVVDNALVQFVMQNKRLPCPADGSIATGGTNAGVETARNAGGCVTQQMGVVPWVSLGIPEDTATDEWGRRLTYRAGNTLTLSEGMNMYWCDPAAGQQDTATPFTWTPTASCLSTCTMAALAGNPLACTHPNDWLAGKGLKLTNIAGTILKEHTPAAAVALTDLVAPNGAAYFVISHGQTGGGGYNSSGILTATTTTDGTAEQANYASLVLQTTYFDDALSEVAGINHFDDVVLSPTIMNVVNRAGLNPRAHP